MSQVNVRLINNTDDHYHHNIAIRLAYQGSAPNMPDLIWHSIQHLSHGYEHPFSVDRIPKIHVENAYGQTQINEPLKYGDEWTFDHKDQVLKTQGSSLGALLKNHSPLNFKKVTVLNQHKPCLQAPFLGQQQQIAFTFKPVLYLSVFSRSKIRYRDCFQHYHTVNLMPFKSLNLLLCGGGYDHRAKPYFFSTEKETYV